MNDRRPITVSAASALLLASLFANAQPAAPVVPATAPAAAPVAQPVAPATAPAAPTPPAAPEPVLPPDTDVFVADLDLAAGKIGAPRNLTARAGYDNQPAFLIDGSGLLFVVELEGEKTDVWRHDFATGANQRVTATPEAEYSPTPLPDGRSFSAVRVEAPDAPLEAFTESQRLFRYGFDGLPIGPVHPDWKRVGYHAWLDEGHLALWLVGGGPSKVPNTLVHATVADGKLVPLARDAGASIARSPEGRISFVDQSLAATWSVATLLPGEARPTTVTPTPKVAGEAERERARDLCWLPDGTLLMPRGAQLLRFDPRQPELGWVRFAELGALGGEIRRPTVSRDGKRIAFVVDFPRVKTRGIRG